MERLKDKVAAISGTGGGQGRAAAVRFAQEGAKIHGCDIKVEGSHETAEIMTACGGDMVSTAPVDLSDPEATRRWIDDAASAEGGSDILYTNARRKYSSL